MTVADIKLCEPMRCTGCGACAEVCPKDAISIDCSFAQCSARIDAEACIRCGRCMRVCPELVPVPASSPKQWYQGWAARESERRSSSSGGVCAAIERAFIEHGGTVFACAFTGGDFRFVEVSGHEGVESTKGSKYVKSNPRGIYIAVRERLRSNRNVLFVGLPCQVAALRNILSEQEAERLSTVDLICHGTPSRCMLVKYLAEHGIDIDNASDIQFRKKGCFQLRIDGRPVDVPGITDAYLIAFLSGLSYTDGCYRCRYASIRRVSDVTLGDSWGTNLVEEIPSGISLVLCQTDKGEILVRNAQIKLSDVDLERAIANNGQLDAPFDEPGSRASFLRKINALIPFDCAVALCLPKAYVRQQAKWLLNKLHLIKRGRNE